MAILFLRRLALAATLSTGLVWAGCTSETPSRNRADRPTVEAEETLFTKLPAAYTNVDFTNDLTYTEDTNVFTYRNYHNGGGVGIGDFNGDGNQDLLAGNLGLNSRIRATPKEPARLYLGDFDRDNSPDPILTYYRNGKSYPHAGRDVLLQRFPFLREKFPTYESFGASQIGDLFSDTKIREATVKDAHTFATSYFQNQGDGTFSTSPLPSRGQFAPVYDILSSDLTGDGKQEVVMGGNFSGVKSRQGRYDASYGTVLQHHGDDWTAMPAPKSNLYLQGQIRALRLIKGAEGHIYLLAARNDAKPQLLRLQNSREEK